MSQDVSASPYIASDQRPGPLCRKRAFDDRFVSANSEDDLVRGANVYNNLRKIEASVRLRLRRTILPSLLLLPLKRPRN